jgi:hypothetical protein
MLVTALYLNIPHETYPRQLQIAHVQQAFELHVVHRVAGELWVERAKRPQPLSEFLGGGRWIERSGVGWRGHGEANAAENRVFASGSWASALNGGETQRGGGG